MIIRRLEERDNGNGNGGGRTEYQLARVLSPKSVLGTPRAVPRRSQPTTSRTASNDTRPVTGRRADQRRLLLLLLRRRRCSSRVLYRRRGNGTSVDDVLARPKIERVAPAGGGRLFNNTRRRRIIIIIYWIGTIICTRKLLPTCTLLMSLPSRTHVGDHHCVE